MEFSRSPKRSIEISLVPMIDVAMFMLIFFMVAGTIVKFEIIPVDPPKAVSGKLMEEGHIIILLGTHEEIVVDDELVESMEGLETTIRTQLASNPNKIITVKADQGIPAVRMIQVMDRIKLAGGRNLSLATQSVDAKH